MNDQDLGDLIAYLKQIPPVNTNYPEMRYGPLVPIFSDVGLLPSAAAQIDHGAPRPADPMPGATVEYGGYLSTNCTACHGNGIGNVVNKWKQEKSMYPQMIADAKAEKNPGAERSFTYANEVEKVHADLYQKALAQLGKNAETDYYVCSVCGNTVEDHAPEECPVCGAKKQAFRKID